MSELPENSQVHRILLPSEQLQQQEVDATAFLYSFDPSSFKADSEESMQEKPYECWGFGYPVTSAMTVHDFDICFDHHTTRATGIGGVATLPEARGQGGIRSLFEALLPRWYEQGYTFSLLYPFSHVFYRKFGYEMVQESSCYDIPVDSLSAFSCKVPVQAVTHYEQVQDIEHAFSAKYNLSIRRKSQQWGMISAKPTKDLSFAYKIGDDAYVTFNRRRTNNPADDRYLLNVTDLAFLNEDAFRHLLGFLYGMNAQFGMVHLPMPGNVPLMHMLPEPYVVTHKKESHGMARVVNVASVLKMMDYDGLSLTFALRLRDEQIARNNGLFMVTVKNGQATFTCEEVDKEAPKGLPVIETDIQHFTLLSTGAVSLDQTGYLDGVRLLENGSGAEERNKLYRVFRHKNIFFTDAF